MIASRRARANGQGGSRVQEGPYIARTLVTVLEIYFGEGSLLIRLSDQAKNHGNEPSKGAKIDAELKADDEAAMKKKGSWGSKQ